MSMTREEAFDIIENKIQIDVRLCTDEEIDQYQNALYMALAALRTPARKQVERMRGEWIVEDAGEGDRRGKCSMCSNCAASGTPGNRFCHHCGSPMADEAVDIIMERLEALKDDN